MQVDAAPYLSSAKPFLNRLIGLQPHKIILESPHCTDVLRQHPQLYLPSFFYGPKAGRCSMMVLEPKAGPLNGPS